MKAPGRKASPAVSGGNPMAGQPVKL